MVCHEPATMSQAFIRVSETDPDASPMGVSSGECLGHVSEGIEDGPNLYAYVKENPWSAFDAKGLDLTHLGQAWMSGDFSLKTFVGEGGLGQAVLHMPAPNDIARQFQHGVQEGKRIAAIASDAANKHADSKLGRAAVYTAAATGGLISSVTGIDAIHESIAGSRVEANSSGQLENRQLGTVERVMKGVQGAVQVGAIIVGGKAGMARNEAVVEEALVSKAELNQMFPRVKPTKGMRAETWESAKTEEGKVLDPSGVEIKPGEQWEMGHTPGNKFSDAQMRAYKQKWGSDMWKKYQKDVGIYRPEKPRTNRGHKFE
jgi:hypothetical protein